jgi:hypothetical protein
MSEGEGGARAPRWRVGGGLLGLLVLCGCGPDPYEDTDTDSEATVEVGWTRSLDQGASSLPEVSGFQLRRTIIHVHSPFSHDACDGAGWVDGVFNEECLMDFRRGMCEAGIDIAFLTDHPAHVADQSFEDLYHNRDGDELVLVNGDPVANWVACEDGERFMLIPGVEDELMPVGLDRQIAETPEERDELYNRADAESLAAMKDAGATIWMAHTEGRDLTWLEGLQDAGLDGVEMFNLHAMFDPDIRKDDLGLDSLSWVSDIAPFTHPEAVGEPDLFVLAVLQKQQPSFDRLDSLLQRGPMGASGGTDAHQNVLNLELRDGERGDSYRRMLRWFSNWLMVEEDTMAAYESALRARRMALVFEILGTPSGFGFHLEDGSGTRYEMGSDAPAGMLHISCPTLALGSPRGLDDPEISVAVYRNGELWQSECGLFEASGPAAYRVEVSMTPHHLVGFLGDDPEPWVKSYPWIFSNAIRVGF